MKYHVKIKDKNVQLYYILLLSYLNISSSELTSDFLSLSLSSLSSSSSSSSSSFFKSYNLIIFLYHYACSHKYDHSIHLRTYPSENYPWRVKLLFTVPPSGKLVKWREPKVSSV